MSSRIIQTDIYDGLSAVTSGRAILRVKIDAAPSCREEEVRVGKVECC